MHGTCIKIAESVVSMSVRDTSIEMFIFFVIEKILLHFETLYLY